jgi:hypothetical protein
MTKSGFTIDERNTIKNYFISNGIYVDWKYDCELIGNIDVEPTNYTDEYNDFIELPNYATIEFDVNVECFTFKKARIAKITDYSRKNPYTVETDRILIWSKIEDGLDKFLDAININLIRHRVSFTKFSDKEEITWKKINC